MPLPKQAFAKTVIVALLQQGQLPVREVHKLIAKRFEPSEADKAVKLHKEGAAL